MDTNRKIMIIAGEASGDIHGARLVNAMQALTPGLEFSGIGGHRLRQAGVDIAEVKRLVGRKVCLMGNVNCAKLHTGTDEEVIESSIIASQLKRIADTLERLLKISEMSR